MVSPRRGKEGIGLLTGSAAKPIQTRKRLMAERKKEKIVWLVRWRDYTQKILAHASVVL